MYKSIYVIAITLLSASLLGQDQLTYHDAVQIALEQNISLRQQKNLLELNRAQTQQGYANFLPAVNAFGSGDRIDGRQWLAEEARMDNRSVDRASYTLGADLTVFNGFQKVYQLNRSKENLEAQLYLVEQSTQDLILQTSQRYLQILLDIELLTVLEKNLSVQQLLYDRVKAQQQLGSRTVADLLGQEAQLKTSELQLLQMQNQLHSDKANLSRILMLDISTDFTVEAPNWDVDSIMNFDYQLDSLWEEALRNRPTIYQMKAQQDAAKQSLNIARTSLIPRINVFYNYGSSYASNATRQDVITKQYNSISFREQLENANVTQQYGFNITVPIFNRLTNRANIIQSRIAYENAQLDYLDFEKQMDIDIENAYTNHLAFTAAYRANVVRAAAEEKSYERQQEMYRLGQGSIVDLTVQNQRYMDALSEKLQSKFTLLFQQIVIDYNIGTLAADSNK